MIRYIINIFLSIIPSTRLFRLKSLLVSIGNSKLGKNVCFNQNVKFYGNSNVVIGNNTWVGVQCSFFSSSPACIRIGSNCDIAPNVLFNTGSHEIGDSLRRAGSGKSDSINVGDGTWIGSSVTILGGANIGKGSIISAGSLVLPGDYPKNTLLGGVPAKGLKALK